MSIKDFLNKPIPKRIYIRTEWLRKWTIYISFFGAISIGYFIFSGIFPRWRPDGSLNPWYFIFLPLLVLFIVVVCIVSYCCVGYIEKFFLSKKSR